MKNNKETLELINNDFLGFMNKASTSAGEVFREDYKAGELKYITPSEPPYKGDLGFKNHYIAIKDMAKPILDMFINDYNNRFKLMKDIDELDFNEFKYVMFMYRRDGYVHDWTFTTKNEEEIEMDYLKSKLDNFGCDYELRKGFYGSYLIYTKNRNTADFIDFEAKLIIDFIEKFNSDYGLFFTDNENHLKECEEGYSVNGFLVD